MKNKILIIEDNTILRENVAEILELANYEVRTAENGKIGVEMVLQERPDLIICDIMMPVLDGYGVLHLLSKNDETASIPFIFLTAKAERGDFRKGMEMGADDYLTKPFDDIELLNAIEGRLKKMELFKKEFSKDIKGLNEFFNTAHELNELIKISDNKETRVFRKKEVIYTEGSYPKLLFFVNKGKVKTFLTNEDGKEFITGLYNEGEFFGYLPLIEEVKYPDSATAIEETELYLVPSDDFFVLINYNQEVARKFIKMLSGSLQQKEEQLIKLAYNSVRKRVAEALVDLHNRYNTTGDAAIGIQLSREDLAGMVGTSQETAIRTLSDFKSEGLISIKGSAVGILNIEKLERMKN
jgi:CRP/FNR family transcriptional regulator, polysaccharide utilization system transcription regulator